MPNKRYNKQVPGFKEGGRVKKMGGGMMRYKNGGSTNPKMSKAKNKKLAAMYGDKNKITRGDIITAAKKKKEKRNG